jgi:3',5'-cyclic AMP phosphodiesterase CpdA
MIRPHVASDLHGDFTRNRIDEMAVECDVHLILGDGAAPLTHALPMIREAIKDSAPVVYVPGNHDFYHTALHPQSFLQDELARGRELGDSLGIKVLSNDVLIVGTARILGTTLWTDFMAGTADMSRKQKMALSQKGWYGDERYDNARKDYHEDFRQVRFGAPGSKNRFTPSQWLALHDEAMAFLRTELAKDWDGETIVGSHMAPHPNSLMPGHHNHDWLYATTDIDGEMFEKIDLFCHAHIHASRDYEIDGCRVLCNPRGYPNKDGSFENPQWDPKLVIDVERKYAPAYGR